MACSHHSGCCSLDSDSSKKELKTISHNHALDSEKNFLGFFKSQKLLDFFNKAKYRLLISFFFFISYFVLNSFFYPQNPYVFSSYVISLGLLFFPILLELPSNFKEHNFFDENFLMGLGSVGLFILNEYNEAYLLLALFTLGEILESYAVTKSKKMTDALNNLQVSEVKVLNGNQFEILPVEAVETGATIEVHAGERLAFESIVLEGSASMDYSALNGESLPKMVKEGDKVLSGAVCMDAALKLQVEKDYKSSGLYKILELSQTALKKRSKQEKFITSFARIYTPIVLLLASLVFFFLPIFIPTLTYGQAFERALVFLVVSCPCAIVISVPMTYVLTLGQAAKLGILVKGSSVLDAITHIKSIVWDKTGTLTEGHFSLQKIEIAEAVKERDVLKLAGIAENFSKHPLALAVQEECENQKMNIASSLSNCRDIKEYSGKGLLVQYMDKPLLVGTADFLSSQGISLPTNRLKDQMGSSILVAYEGLYLGTLWFSDSLKSSSLQAVQSLREEGVQRMNLFSGDTAQNVQAIGKYLGMDQIFSGLLPKEKLDLLEKEMTLCATANHKEKNVLVVGDGINDAPMLARADLSVSMGQKGSDAAIDLSDVVLMDDNPLKLATLFSLARKSHHIVVFNIIFAILFKFGVLALASMGYANPLLAMMADVGVSMICLFNAMRMYYFKFS